jgi:hypothetical protein
MSQEETIKFCLPYKSLLKVLEAHLTSYWEMDISKQEHWPRNSIKLNQCCLNILEYTYELEHHPPPDSVEALRLFLKFDELVKTSYLGKLEIYTSMLVDNLQLYLNQFRSLLGRKAISTGVAGHVQAHENLQEQLKSELFKLTAYGSKTEKQQTAWRAFKDAASYVESCFIACPDLYVLCMEFGYQGRKQGNDLEPLANDPKWLCEISSRFNRALSNIPDIVGYLQRPVFCFGKGFSLQYVFLLVHNQNNSESLWVTKLGQSWRNIHLDNMRPDSVDQYKIASYYNTNQIFSKFSRSCVGLISRGQLQRRRAFLKWVLEYLVRMPLYLPVDISYLDIDKQFPLIGQLNHPYVPKAPAVELPFPALTQITLSQNDRQNLWKLSFIPHWKSLKLKLSEINVIYNEHYQSRLKGIMDLDPFLALRDIELCMACIRYSSFPAVYLGFTATDGASATKSMAPIGKQLLFLYLQGGLQRVLDIEVSLLKKISLSVLIFIYAIHCNNAKPEIMKNAPLPAFIDTLNLIVQTIRNFLNQQDPKIIHTWLDQYKNHPYTDALKQRLFHQNKQENFISVGALIKKQEASREKSFKEALAYINGLNRQPTYMFAIKLYPDFSLRTKTTRQMCSVLLSRYLDNTKASHLGYIGGWEISGSEMDHALIIFFLLADSVTKIDELGVAIKKSWTSFLKGKVAKKIKDKHSSSANEKHAEKVKQDPPVQQPDATPVTLFSEDGTYNLRNYYLISKPLSVEDRKLMNRQALYYSTRELYFNSENMDLKKRIIKGGTKKKPASKRTNPFFIKPRQKNAVQNNLALEQLEESSLPVTDAEPIPSLTESTTPTSKSPVETSVSPVEVDKEVRQRSVNSEIRNRNHRSINLPPSPQPLKSNEQSVPTSEAESDSSTTPKDDCRDVKSNVSFEVRKKHKGIMQSSSSQQLDDTLLTDSSDISS